VGGDHQQHVVVRRADIRDPLGGNAVDEQVGFREIGERPLGLRSGGWFGGYVEWDLVQPMALKTGLAGLI
jgi:hypothetical protein